MSFGDPTFVSYGVPAILTGIVAIAFGNLMIYRAGYKKRVARIMEDQEAAALRMSKEEIQAAHDAEAGEAAAAEEEYLIKAPLYRSGDKVYLKLQPKRFGKNENPFGFVRPPTAANRTTRDTEPLP